MVASWGACRVRSAGKNVEDLQRLQSAVQPWGLVAPLRAPNDGPADPEELLHQAERGCEACVHPRM